MISRNLRIIARLDIKNEHVIKGVHLEGLRKIGNPIELAEKYYNQGVDEFFFMDAVASLYGRNNLFHIIEECCKKIFVPITIGGGIRSISDIELALLTGADKIAINTQAVLTPNIIQEASRIYGSQCIVGSIEAKRKSKSWEVYIENGREKTGKDVIEWSKSLEQLGVGELLVTSIDKDGTRKGFDNELMNAIADVVSVPLIASGGCGGVEDVVNLSSANSKIDGVALASVFHYDVGTPIDIKSQLSARNINTRLFL